jgi:hypothetical protein
MLNAGVFDFEPKGHWQSGAKMPALQNALLSAMVMVVSILRGVLAHVFRTLVLGGFCCPLCIDRERLHCF